MRDRMASFSLASLGQISIPTAVTQKRLIANPLAGAVYTSCEWTYGGCRNGEPGVLISILQTIARKGIGSQR